MTDVQRSEQLRSIVETIWITMLGIPIDCIEFSASPETKGDFVARIDIEGAWNGSLELACSEGLARFVGAALFQQDPWELDLESSAEAVLELANMIGGNVKALVGEGNRLGLPRSLTEDLEPMLGEREACLLFDCLGEPLVLQLVRSTSCTP